MKLPLILASESPRRRQLLEEAGYKFQVDSVKVSEIIGENLNPPQVVQGLARLKAEALIQCWVQQGKDLKSPNNLVLAADTLVFLETQPLGKPSDAEQARQFLDLLSGRKHAVLTGICLIETGSRRRVEAYDETLVQFKKLSSEQIASYVATGEPLDKAGAYAIQGQGGAFVESTQGSWSNVVGLPLEKLAKVLRESGWEVEGSCAQ